VAEISESIIRYMAARDAQRGERVNRALNSLSARERALVREAAVMGYVRGAMAHAQKVAVPKDSAVVWEVVDACRAFPDLYPLISSLGDATEGADADE
jgi:hypothetical protein